MTELGRLLTAMVTPYTTEGAVDYGHARRLAAHLVRSGNDGIVAVGTTGESPLLNDDEKARLWEEIKQELGPATLVAGSGTNDTRHSVHLTRLAEKAGADAILAVVPYYLRPPQEGIYQHFKAIAESTSLPVILYDVPGRVGTAMTLDTILRLAEIPNIVGNKDATANFAQAAAVIGKLAVPSSGISWMHPFTLFVIAAAGVFHALEAAGSLHFHRLPPRAWYTPFILFCLLWLVLMFLPREFTPFIYAQF